MRTKQRLRTLRKRLLTAMRPAALLPAMCLRPVALLLLAACLPLLNACRTDDLPGMDSDDTPTTTPEELVGQPVCFGGLTVTEVAMDAETRAMTRATATPFVQPGATITIRMTVTPTGGSESKTTYADYTCTDEGNWTPVDRPLYWTDTQTEHTFIAYSPALTADEKANGRNTLSLPAIWTKELYEAYGNYLAGTPVKTKITSSVTLPLTPLLTRIEVKMTDDAYSSARLLTMRTKMQGVISDNSGSGIATTAPATDAPVQEMNLWRTTAATASMRTTAATTRTATATVFRGYALPQTYAQDDIILVHYDLGVADAKVYKASSNLTTLPGTIVTFAVAAFIEETLNVQTAGGLKTTLDTYAASHSGNYPSRLKLTGSLDKIDITTLSTAAGIVAVDMEEATVTEDAFGSGSSFSSETPFYSYAGSIKSIILPGGMKTIPDYAFQYSKLESVVLPDGLTTIGESALENCNIRMLEVPASVNGQESSICQYNKNLTTVIIHCPLEQLSYYAFYDCSNLSTVICADKALQSTAFSQGCAFFGTGLTSLDFLPSSIERLNYRAFGRCQSLVDVELPAAVNYFNQPFYYCINLKRMALDGTVTISVDGSIGSNFANSPELFLFNPGLTETDERVAPFTGDTWGGITWANVHWGYKGTGSKFDAQNYSYHKTQLSPTSRVNHKSPTP